MNKLSIRQLSFERDDVVIFENLSANWCAGDIIQLAGHNGAGKSTLMKLITGILVPTSGSIDWNGHAVASYEFKASLAYLGHSVGIKATMTPLENLSWYFSLHGTKKPVAEVTEPSEQGSPHPEGLDDQALLCALEQVGLGAYRDIPCYQLSAGQQRRAALARLYLSKAPLWVLDEPFTAIDKSGVSALESLIENHASQGGLVVLTTHQSWKSNNVSLLNLEDFRAGIANV